MVYVVNCIAFVACAESDGAIGELRKNHDVLFKCLQVTVESLGDWGPDDVQRNLQGGILTDNDSDLPPELKEIQEALAKKRMYQACTLCVVTLSRR